MQTNLMQQAQAYLLNTHNPARLKVQYKGARRTIFVNDRETAYPRYGMLNVGARRTGSRFDDWAGIERLYIPKQESDYTYRKRIIDKYRKLAATASFTNDFIRDIYKATPSKPLYDNRLSSGVPIEGKAINLSTIGRWCGEYTIRQYLEALREGRKYNSGTFNFQGYDGSLWVNERNSNGDVLAGFSKEYRGCGNGYYYLAINNDTFVGYDID